LLELLDAANTPVVPPLVARALLAPLLACFVVTALLARFLLAALVTLALFPTLLAHLFLAPLFTLALLLALVAGALLAPLFTLALLLALVARALLAPLFTLTRLLALVAGAFLAPLFALALLLPVVGLTAAFLHRRLLRLRLLCSLRLLRLSVAPLLLPLGTGDVLPALSLLALLLALFPALFAALLPLIRSDRLGHSQPAFRRRECRWGNQRTGQHRQRQQPHHVQIPILSSHIEITPSLDSRREWPRTPCS
jgi:hypothetical protein